MAGSWHRAFVVWLLVIACETAHGMLRNLYVTPAIGDFPARRLAVPMAVLLNFAVTWLTVRWIGERRESALLASGPMWVILTAAFEIALGRVLGYGWPRIFEDHDLARGGFMSLGLLALALSPWLAARLRGLTAAGTRR